ncbi:MAG: preprotein translocase subunit SecG [Chthoniobacterales bacterium]|nr:MAG: preprotein translocase subunit SecG [Chthoniobacterales bacterium]
MNILIGILLSLDALVALLMIFIILMQRPKSEGLGAAFGGGVTENIFGAQTTNVLTKFTGWLAGVFFVVTFLLSVLYAHRSVGGSSIRRELMRGAAAQPVAAPATGSPAPAPSTSAKPSDLAVGAVAQQPALTATPSASAAATPPRVP